MTKQSTFGRLLGYMWRYKWISLLALVFILTSLSAERQPKVVSICWQFTMVSFFCGCSLLFWGSMLLHEWLIALSAISVRRLLRICSN